MEDKEIAAVVALFGEREAADAHEFEWLLRRHGGAEFALPKDEARPAPKAPAKGPKQTRTPAKAPTKAPAKKGGSGGWDESQHKRADKGSPGGGRFIPKDGGGGQGKPAPKAKPKPKSGGTGHGRPKAPQKPKMTKQEKVNALVKGVLKALDEVLGQLTSKQAQALIKRIKANATAFIEGQAHAPTHHNPKGGGGGKGGPSVTSRPAPKGGGPKVTKGPGGTTSRPAPKSHPKGGGSTKTSSVAGIVASVQGLLKTFGHAMKPEARKKLQDAVNALSKAAAETEAMAGDTETFAPGDDYSETVCIMAIPAEDDPCHGVGDPDKHATILYFGDRSQSADPERIEGSRALFENVLRLAAQEVEPFTAKVTGIEALGHDDEPAQVWLLDSPELHALFGEIPEIDSEIASMYEDADATRYPEYKPHVTIVYGPEAPPEARQVTEIRFDRLSLWWGDEHVDFPLGSAEFDAILSHFGVVV